MINNRIIRCEVNDIDIYNRYVAVCYINTIDINQWMVKNGWAIAYKYYSIDYINEEKFARENKLGIWNSEFLEPYLYRKKNKN
jgi:endonuclease YncB( thermonuclease family)